MNEIFSKGRERYLLKNKEVEKGCPSMIERFFEARNVVVIGVSHNPKKVGHVIFRNLVRKFVGRVCGVNQGTKPILGRKLYTSIADAKNVELAVVAVKAEKVPKVVEGCGKVGIKNVIVISGGFSELGEEGKKLEQELLKICKKHGIRLLGPNTLGIYVPKYGLDTTFLSDEKICKPRHGKVAILTQSGAIGCLLLDMLGKANVGVSKFISYGNAIDVNATELLEFLGKDKDTGVIVWFFEGVKSRRFAEVLQEVSKKKSIIVLKGGKTKEGSRAASSHTASMAGDYELFRAMFKQYGVLEAENLEELLDYVKAFATQPLPTGRKVCILTDAGGFGVLASDVCQKLGLELKLPSKRLIEKLSKVMPRHIVLSNPLDVTGDADAERYETCLKEVVKEYDAILLIMLFQLPMLGYEVVERVARVWRKVKKPIVICSHGSRQEVFQKFEACGIPVYPSPERAVKALAALYQRFEFVSSKGKIC